MCVADMIDRATALAEVKNILSEIEMDFGIEFDDQEQPLTACLHDARGTIHHLPKVSDVKAESEFCAPMSQDRVLWAAGTLKQILQSLGFLPENVLSTYHLDRNALEIRHQNKKRWIYFP